jgi:Xaa-Pro dipeptidase
MRRRDFLGAVGLAALGCATAGIPVRKRIATVPPTDIPLDAPPELPPLERAVFAARRAQIWDTLKKPLVVQSGSSNFQWLVGADFFRSERLIALVVAAESYLVAPTFEVGRIRLRAGELPIRGWEENADPLALLPANALVDPRADYALAQAVGCGESAAVPLEALRIAKSDEELARIRRAVAVTEAAIAATFDQLDVGMTDREVSKIVAQEHEKRGARGGGLVQFGPASALPHGSPTGARLADGTVVLIDCGGSVEGYDSDITRTRWFGSAAPPAKFREIYDIVHDAQTAAFGAARVGAPAREVDRAARAVIERAGFGEFFTHRLGHGIGLDGHEAPWLRSGNDAPLLAGAVFTIEPGIYLPGEFGVRIEDDVVLSPSGPAWISRRAARLA